MTGDDLAVQSGPGIPAGLVIPAAELLEQFTRSSGPGGQSVNTSDTRVQLTWDPATSTALTDTQRARVVEQLGAAYTVVAAEHRSQHRNRLAARERLADAIRSSLAPPPPPRVPTKPSKRARQRRLDAKKQRGHTKSLRGRVKPD